MLTSLALLAVKPPPCQAPKLKQKIDMVSKSDDDDDDDYRRTSRS